MSKELPTHNTGFTYDEQYRTAGWRATFRMFELLGDDPIIEDETKPLTQTMRAMATIALKDVASFIDETIKTRKFPYYNDFIQYRMITSRDLCVDEDLENMSLIYTQADEIWREIGDQYDMQRFDDDIEKLAKFHFAQLKELIDEPSFSVLEFVARMQHDNDFYLGMWDIDRTPEAAGSEAA